MGSGRIGGPNFNQNSFFGDQNPKMASNLHQGESFLDLDLLRSDPWQWWRNQMPITQKWAYFDHAAVSPLSQPAVDAIERFARQASRQGDTVWPQWAASLATLREAFAELINADRSEISLVPNTTAGINLIAEGWPWQPGDNVVLPDGEFPSNLFPWQHQRDRGLEVRIVPRQSDGSISPQTLLEHTDRHTKLVSVSWVGYASGFRIDLDELVQRAHQKNILVFVDAIQGLGMYRLDLQQTPIDFLAADGHKWLLGPEGAGMAMIRKEHLNKIRCPGVGWGSVKNPYNYHDPCLDLRDDAARFEAGSANMVGNQALLASLNLILGVHREHGPRAIETRILALTNSLASVLTDLGATIVRPDPPEHQSGILNFQIPGIEPNTIRKSAIEKNVVVSCRGGGVRASVHAYNNEQDLQRLVDVVKSLLK